MKCKLKSIIAIGAIVMSLSFSLLFNDLILKENTSSDLEPFTELPFEHK